eukprot:gene13448-9259_t
MKGSTTTTTNNNNNNKTHCREYIYLIDCGIRSEGIGRPREKPTSSNQLSSLPPPSRREMTTVARQEEMKTNLPDDPVDTAGGTGDGEVPHVSSSTSRRSEDEEDDFPSTTSSSSTAAGKRGATRKVCTALLMTGLRLLIRHGSVALLLAYWGRIPLAPPPIGSSSGPTSCGSTGGSWCPSDAAAQQRVWRWGFPLASAALPNSLYEPHGGSCAPPPPSSITAAAAPPPSPPPGLRFSLRSLRSWEWGTCPLRSSWSLSSIRLPTVFTDGEVVPPVPPPGALLVSLLLSPLLHVNRLHLLGNIVANWIAELERDFVVDVPERLRRGGLAAKGKKLRRDGGGGGGGGGEGRQTSTAQQKRRHRRQGDHGGAPPTQTRAAVAASLGGKAQVIQSSCSAGEEGEPQVGSAAAATASGYRDSRRSRRRPPSSSAAWEGKMKRLWAGMQATRVVDKILICDPADAAPSTATSSACHRRATTTPHGSHQDPQRSAGEEQAARSRPTIGSEGEIAASHPTISGSGHAEPLTKDHPVSRSTPHWLLISWRRLGWCCLRTVGCELAVFYIGSILGGMGGEWLWYRGLCWRYWQLLQDGLLLLPSAEGKAKRRRSTYHPASILAGVTHAFFPNVMAPSSLWTSSPVYQCPVVEATADAGTSAFASMRLWVPAVLGYASGEPPPSGPKDKDKEGGASATAHRQRTTSASVAAASFCPATFAALKLAQQWFEMRVVVGRKACGASAGVACSMGYNVGIWVWRLWWWRRKCQRILISFVQKLARDDARRYHRDDGVPSFPASGPRRRRCHGGGGGGGGVCHEVATTALPSLPQEGRISTGTSPVLPTPTSAGAETGAGAGEDRRGGEELERTTSTTTTTTSTSTPAPPPVREAGREHGVVSPRHHPRPAAAGARLPSLLPEDSTTYPHTSSRSASPSTSQRSSAKQKRSRAAAAAASGFQNDTESSVTAVVAQTTNSSRWWWWWQRRQPPPHPSTAASELTHTTADLLHLSLEGTTTTGGSTSGGGGGSFFFGLRRMVVPPSVSILSSPSSPLARLVVPLFERLHQTLPPPPPPPPIASLLHGVSMMGTTAAHFIYVYALAANPMDLDVYATMTTVLPKPSPFSSSSSAWDGGGIAAGWESMDEGQHTAASRPVHNPYFSGLLAAAAGIDAHAGLAELADHLGPKGALQRVAWSWWLRCWDVIASHGGHFMLGLPPVSPTATAGDLRRRAKLTMVLLSTHAGHTGGFLVGLLLGLGVGWRKGEPAGDRQYGYECSNSDSDVESDDSEWSHDSVLQT